MIPTLFERGTDGFVVPRVNPEAAWVLEEVTFAVSSKDLKIQLADIQVLDLHEMEAIDAFRVLRDMLEWLPESIIFISTSDDTRSARLRREDFDYGDPTE
jgi:hypothetical protein